MKIVKTLINEFDILITSALGLVTALAWNEAFKNYFQNHKHLKKYGPKFMPLPLQFLVF